MMQRIYREELKDELGVFLTIEISEGVDWIYVDWIGYMDENRAKSGMMRYLEIMEKYNLTKLLNDNRREHGPYPENIDLWIREAWIPYAKKINFKYGATIVSRKVFARISADMLVRKFSGITYRNFEDEEEAIKWLSSLK